MSESDKKEAAIPDICVMTHPLSAAGENATRSLLDILSALTTVVLVTADLPRESSIRRNHEVIEISRKTASQDSVFIAALRFLLNQFRMVSIIVRRNEEIIHFYGATAYVLPVLTAKVLGKTVLVEPRGDVPLTLRLTWEREYPRIVARTLAGGVRLLERTGFVLADGIITYTPGMADQLGLDTSDPKVYSEGARYVDTEQFAPAKPFTQRDRRVGFVGRLDEEKGIRALAKAASLLPEDIVFRFVGDGPLSPWVADALENEIDRGRVEMTGWVKHSDVPAELNELQLLVLPSSPTEGLPTMILEALACGTPVIATPVSGVPDVIHDEETGFLMKSTSPEDIADQIEHVLNRDDLSTVSSNGRRLIEQKYSFKSAVERYNAILSTVSSK